MSENGKDLELAVAKALEIFEERQAAKEEKEKYEQALREEGYQAGLEEGKKEAEAWAEKKGAAPVVMETAKLGSGGETGDNDAFRHWMQTGDYIAARKSLQEESVAGEIAVDGMSAKALQEGTGSEGGFLVPDDFVAGIVGLRNERAWTRMAGVRVIQTNRDVIDIPAVASDFADFTRTAEEGTYTTDDPSFNQNQVTVHKWTKVTRVSEELLADDAAGLEGFMQEDVARAWASTESRYAAVGTGSNQHTGIFTGGDTDALTFNTDAGADSDGNLLPDSMWRLYFTLNEGYRSDAVWLADGLTLRDILALKHTQANPNWAFQAADMLEVRGPDIYLLGKRFFQNDNIDTKSANVCFIMFGSPAYYALVERQGLIARRNPFLHMSLGQVAFYWTFRQGGTVLVEASWVGGVGA